MNLLDTETLQNTIKINLTCGKDALDSRILELGRYLIKNLVENMETFYHKLRDPNPWFRMHITVNHKTDYLRLFYHTILYFSF